MSKYKVRITRTEVYSRDVEVEAADLEKAIQIAKHNDEQNEYEGLFDVPDNVSSTFKDGGNGEYHLADLESVDIDSWVEGISLMCGMDKVRKEAYAMAGLEEDENHPICPAEMEKEYTELSEKYGFRFNSKGQIIKYNLSLKRQEPTQQG